MRQIIISSPKRDEARWLVRVGNVAEVIPDLDIAK
jgi:hypothetical protein